MRGSFCSLCVERVGVSDAGASVSVSVRSRVPVTGAGMVGVVDGRCGGWSRCASFPVVCGCSSACAAVRTAVVRCCDLIQPKRRRLVRRVSGRPGLRRGRYLGELESAHAFR